MNIRYFKLSGKGLGYIGIMEKKMETTTMGYIGLYRVHIGYIIPL